MKLIRGAWYTRTTVGKLFDCNDVFMCWTLEDTVRTFGIKVKAETALAAGIYRLKMRHSPKFNMELPVIYTESDGVTANMGGISFKYAMFHGGTNHEHTEGCILNGVNRVGNKIEVSNTQAIIKEVENGDNILEIINQKSF